MKLLAISDLHGYLPPIEPCDLLVIAGDLCPFINHRVDAQAEFINDEFADWLERIPARHIVGIAGNHDFVFERSPHLVSDRLRWTYLRDAEIAIEGVRIYGTPWCPVFLDWAFNVPEPQLAKKWKTIPAGLNILITHTPPYGYGDRTSDGQHVGSESLRERVRAVTPQLMIVGHVHEARGAYRMPGAGGSETIVANVSHLDARSEPRHHPVEFTIEAGNDAMASLA